MSLPLLHYVLCWCLLWCLLSGSHVAAMLTSGGSLLGFCNTTTVLEDTFGRHIYILVMVCGPHQEYTEVSAPSTALSRGGFMLLIQLFLSHFTYMVEHLALGAGQRVTRSLCLPCMVEMGLLFQVVF